MKNRLLIVLIALFCANITVAQDKDSSLFLSTVKHLGNDTKNLFISPTKWDKKEVLIFGGLSVATGALIAWGDQPIYDYANTIHTDNLDVFFLNLRPMGNLYPAMVISAMALKGVIAKDNYAVETSIIATESYVLTGLVTQLTKITASRNRPNDFNTTNSHQWNGPFFKGTSFFSGHTTTAFSVASVFAYRYKDTKWVPILSYSLATLSGIQRIYHNRHWTSDVLVGAAVGTATGVFLCKQWENNSIHFYPVLTGNGGGLSMVVPIR